LETSHGARGVVGGLDRDGERRFAEWPCYQALYDGTVIEGRLFFKTARLQFWRPTFRSEYALEACLQDQVEFAVAQPADRSTERALAGLTIFPPQLRLEEMPTFSKRHRSIESQKSRYESVVVVWLLVICRDAVYPGDGEIRLATAAA